MSWPEAKFETLYAEPSRNGVYKAKEHHGSGAKIVNMGELFGHEFVGPQDMARLSMSEQELEKSGLREGDLLFGRRSLVEAGAGKCSIVEGINEPTTFESSIIRARLDPEKCDPRFYYYWFRSPQGRGRIRSIVSGTNVKGIRGSDLKNLPVVQPDISTQCRVVEMVRPYDDLIETNRRRIALLDEAARLLYREWFVHFRFPGHEHVPLIDGLPEGWERRKLGEVAETNRESYRAKELPDEIDYIDISSVAQGRVVSKTRMPVSEAPGRARRKVRDGDVIWSNVRPNLRAYALILDPDDLDVVSTGFTVLSASSVPFTWLYMFVTMDGFVGHLINHATGAGYPAVRPDDFERAELVLPPKPLLDNFHEATEPNFRLIRILDQQNRKLAEARDLLLPRLMNREIAV